VGAVAMGVVATGDAAPVLSVGAGWSADAWTWPEGLAIAAALAKPFADADADVGDDAGVGVGAPLRRSERTVAAGSGVAAAEELATAVLRVAGAVASSPGATWAPAAEPALAAGAPAVPISGVARVSSRVSKASSVSLDADARAPATGVAGRKARGAAMAVAALIVT
jgi:hypothetical protein